MQAFLKGGSAASKSKPDAPATPLSTKKSKDGKTKIVPWIEKYRPKNVEDVAYQDEVVAVLKKSLEGSDLPNLLFYGPPGTGKTSTILAIARQLFGSDIYKDRVLELNASDERGISVIREKVKKFAQLTAGGSRPDGKPCPPFKIIILDEADSMTKDAQSALRRTMERESKTTRFCLICNYVSRIIEPITSRCAKFRFKALAEDILSSRLKAICEGEGVSIEDSAVEAVIKTSEGDMRKAIMTLQSASRLCGKEGHITAAMVYDIAGVIPDDDLDKVISTCSSDSYSDLDLAVQRIIMEGFAASQLLSQLHDKIVVMDSLSDLQKSIIALKMAEVDKCLMDGADEYLQLMALFATIMQQICHGP
ncbi:replication factor C subunit 4-like [Physella acuta]|uniref:replication factor C subunit 4-like n=1 Tax=Physella acuta TaxID=109671 RepID=UPI0027DBE649|nr:replication factor C subunit 4-like [Physella acuta]XP_059164193.1 replication factor C subunit 4-like [Physella acuta]XP_059164194.1 replication factor C subunit 4-like [Physella acuta]